MSGRLGSAGARVAWAVGLVLLVATACSVPEPPRVVGPGQRDGDATLNGGGWSLGFEAGTEPGGPESGISLVPILSSPVFVFGPEVSAITVQPMSQRLLGSIPPRNLLEVKALPSPQGTAALALRETTTTEDRWGSLNIPAQRRIYSAFARDARLGDWLVLVTDIRVLDGSDPIPMMAYRWERAAVESYAACGIPPVGVGVPWTEIDDCTDEFFVAGDQVLVRPRAPSAGQ